MCDNCPKCCPFAAHMNESFLTKSQEVIFWRRPIASAVVLAFVDLMFLIARGMNMSFLATVCFVNLVHIAISILDKIIGGIVIPLLFKGDLPADEQDAPNRIRSFEEAKAYLHGLFEKKNELKKWLSDYLENPTLERHLIFFGASFIVFTICTVLGSWWTLFLITNFVLIVPGVYYCPKVRNFVSTKIEQAKQKAE